MSMSAITPRTVHLAVYDTLADWETGHAVAHINNPEYQLNPGTYQVRTVGPTTEPIRTAGGVHIVPDLALTDLDPSGSALLILPGASAYLSGELTEFIDAATRFLDAGVPVAGICGATVAMAQAGILDDRQHTSNAPEALASTGYAGSDHYVDSPAVTDRSRPGHLITAAAMHPVPFAREIFAELDLYSADTLAAWVRLYSGDPAGYYDLMAATA